MLIKNGLLIEKEKKKELKKLNKKKFKGENKVFHIFAKKLEGEEIIEAIKIMRAEKGTKANKAFTDLRDTFAGLIFKKIKSVNSLAHSQSEREEIKQHVESSFVEVLMDPHMELTDYKRIIGYIASAFNTKINIHSIQELLGHDEIVKDVWKYKVEFKNALKRYMNDHNKKAPDFDEEEELNDFAKNYMNKKVESVLDILKMFSTSTIRSMEQELGGGDEGDDNAITLMDTLKTNEPLPDQVLQDKELMHIFLKEIDKLLTPRQKKLFLMYRLPDNPETEKLLTADEKKKLEEKDKERMKELEEKGKGDTKQKPLTNDELAEITGIAPRTVREDISVIKEKLLKSEELKELVASRRINRLVKYALKNYYSTTEDLVFEIVASFKNSNKKLDMQEIKRITHEIFEPNLGELDKNFSDFKGEITYSDNEGIEHLEITGLVKKEWLNKYYGEDEDLKKIEKQLSKNYSSGPGKEFSRLHVTLQSKNKDFIKFVVTTYSGLDI
jgi:RNA polymerase sigma factor (sigma-70 family)